MLGMTLKLQLSVPPLGITCIGIGFSYQLYRESVMGFGAVPCENLIWQSVLFMWPSALLPNG
ncbi:hypothetical protein PS874_03844 [Pseudomonas fluorescens]|nr:hypothetical protein PS874_03844 [Pseudomonas fluorescens]